MKAQDRRGFTLVELLVVITIIAILVGLTMPAVNMAREAMRRTTCLNNLSQLGKAAMAHETKFQALPTGGWGSGWAGDPTRGFSSRQPGGWLYNILPFLERQDLHDLAAQTRVTFPVDTFICPSRRRPDHYPYASSTPNSYFNAGTPTNVGKNDYAANAGTYAGDTDVVSFRGPSSLSAGDTMANDVWAAKPGGSLNNTGVIFRHSECKMADIKDGQSNTYLFGERFLDPDFYRTGTRLDDDQSWDTGYDNQVNRWGVQPARQDTSLAKGLPTGFTLQDSFTWYGSAHSAGFNMCFCDGSARRISFGIDPMTHKSLSTRAGREIINPGDIN
jgi:prepilin-type N-terminal cleavage/methylation domain-containing protein/prepilin-type processing-associated H-X9-DG protein